MGVQRYTNLETTTAKINNFDTTFSWLLQQDIFWLEVAVYDTLLKKASDKTGKQ